MGTQAMGVDPMCHNMVTGCDKYGYWGMPDQCFEPQAFGHWASMFFIVYIFLSSMMILNLFIGVITNSIQDAKSELGEEKELSERAAMREELNRTQNTSKKIELQFKQIICSISDIHKHVPLTLSKGQRMLIRARNNSSACMCACVHV